MCDTDRINHALSYPCIRQVWQVDASPGDPDQLTLKAARLIQTADAIGYDHRVGEGACAIPCRRPTNPWSARKPPSTRWKQIEAGYLPLAVEHACSKVHASGQPIHRGQRQEQCRSGRRLLDLGPLVPTHQCVQKSPKGATEPGSSSFCLLFLGEVKQATNSLRQKDQAQDTVLR